MVNMRLCELDGRFATSLTGTAIYWGLLLLGRHSEDPSTKWGTGIQAVNPRRLAKPANHAAADQFETSI